MLSRHAGRCCTDPILPSAIFSPPKFGQMSGPEELQQNIISLENSSQAPTTEKSNDAPVTDAYRAHALRRSERIRNQELKAEALRKQREERAKIEEARAKQRSIAAKKAAQTKRKAQLAQQQGEAEAAAANASGQSNGTATETKSGKNGTAKIAPAEKPKTPKRNVLKLKYGTPLHPPQLIPVDLERSNTSWSLFWLRANIREFLLRFDKLCRLPTRLSSSVNDILQPWVAEQMKPVILALLKLIANDQKPLLPNVRDYIVQIDLLEPQDERIWDWLVEFVEQLDPYVPDGVPETEEEQLALLQRLVILCTGTETIRVTVTSDADQLRYVEKDSQDEIKKINAKLKETQGKLAKLKSVDPQVYSDRLAAAQRSTDNKIWKVQQQLYTKMHKYNSRTTPIATDPLGNNYWAFQYRSATQTAWGSWIVCEMKYDPKAIVDWYSRFSGDISDVISKRDEMLAEKASERKRARKEKAAAVKSENSNEPDQNRASSEIPTSEVEASKDSTPQGPATSGTTDVKSPSGPSETIASSADVKQEYAKSDPSSSGVKRKYPKLKIDFPEPFDSPRLFYVEGKDEILELSAWIAGLSKGAAKTIPEINEVAEYLSQ